MFKAGKYDSNLKKRMKETLALIEEEKKKPEMTEEEFRQQSIKTGIGLALTGLKDEETRKHITEESVAKAYDEVREELLKAKGGGKG